MEKAVIALLIILAVILVPNLDPDTFSVLNANAKAADTKLQRAIDSSVLVNGISDPGRGSGFFVAREYILTANHVLPSSSRANIVMNDGSQLSATVVARDLEHDLALLKSDSKSNRFLRLQDFKKVRIGQEVYLIGDPLGSGGNSVKFGIVSFIPSSLESSFEKATRIDANGAGGMSGGPVVNPLGRVIGIINARTRGDVVFSHNSDTIEDFIESYSGGIL